MKKSDLKTLIKPIVKECIYETLLEEGLLSNIVTEVAPGLNASTIVEQNQKTRAPHKENRRQKKTDHTKKLMEAIGKDAYNGVNLFEGTSPMNQYASQNEPEGSVDLGAPADPGVDIRSLVGNASKIWQSMK